MSRNRAFAALVTTLLTVLALSIPAPAQARPGAQGDLPDGVRLEAVTVNGSGCKPGTATIEYSDDHTAVRVSYREYVAEGGDGALPTGFRKNCQISLHVIVPEGMRYRVNGAHSAGFSYLHHGVRAVQRTNYYFQGTSPTAHAEHSWVGRVSDDWLFDDDIESAMLWSPCGLDRNLNMNTEVRVYATQADPWSFVWADSTEIDARKDLVFGKC